MRSPVKPRYDKEKNKNIIITVVAIVNSGRNPEWVCLELTIIPTPEAEFSQV
jgi:hypothetical protein